jgi:hypothetical protein
MARALTYNHSRFDGGMTHNRRDTSDLTKLGLISHLDIYRDRNTMHVMPGYVADMAYDSDAVGMKDYDAQAFGRIDNNNDSIFVLAKKSDGSGSKIFERILSGTEWIAPTTIADLATEGSADFHYPVKSSSNTVVARHGANASPYTASWQAWLTAVQPTERTYAVRAFTGTTYLTKGGAGSGLSSITSSAVVENAKTTALSPTHIVSGNYQVGIVGRLANPRRSQTLLWDSASLLADQNIQTGKGTGAVIGYPSGLWATVSASASSTLEANGKGEMTIRFLSGETADTLYKVSTVSSIDSVTDLFALNDTYHDAMVWYGKVEVATGEYIQGMWALGKGETSGQFGVSLLLNTSSLGAVRNAHMFGYSTYFIHGGDGSISRLGDYQTGTYNVPATIETLIYGAESPYQKELQGVSIVTEDLPTGGSVVAYYRTDTDNAWVELGTSNIVGKQRHSFTKATGTPIGKFQEIEFKFVITGKTSVKNIRVDIIETDNLPY